MKLSEIIEIQTRIGTTPDGKFGPKSRAALRAHLRAMMPDPNPWPEDNVEAITERFGQAGDEDNLVNLSVIGLGICYDGTPSRSVRCHKLVRDSLLAILTDISNGPHRSILSQYAGCFNFRPMRGGKSPSRHSWGIAIDLAPDTNGNLAPWPEVATMPLGVMEAFARQGWLSAGADWGRDAMHMQASR